MERTSRNGRLAIPAGSGAAVALATLCLVLCLVLATPSTSGIDNGKGPTFEDRAAAERTSRSRYRDLEVASLVVILVGGAGAIFWAVRRKKP